MDQQEKDDSDEDDENSNQPSLFNSQDPNSNWNSLFSVVTKQVSNINVSALAENVKTVQNKVLKNKY